jgi:NhaA family Na+:H+ antiporter
MGVLALLGNRVPNALKLFLLTLAIVDDMGAIVIIALFYTADLSVSSLVVAAAALLVLWMLNRRGVVSIVPYALVGLVMWVAVLKSGVHATLAGVLVALFIPLKSSDEAGSSPLEKLEHELHPTVAFVILPLFAFMNTGVSLQGLSWDSVLAPVPLGIAAGLFLGNQFGVFGFSWLAVKLGIGRLPAGASWTQLYGVALLCGIGFTMSLFISSLAFEQGGSAVALNDRLGILAGSIVSALAGYLVLRFTIRSQPTAE